MTLHPGKSGPGAGSGSGSVAKRGGGADKPIAKNRKAEHDYFIEQSFEAGIELTGTEVRSLRDGGGQLTDSFALIRGGELWLHGLHIRPFAHGNRANVEPDRKRRLLMHKKQIRYLGEQVQQVGMALVPLSLYFSEKGLVKVALGLARGKKHYDKRQTLAERDSKREVERVLKQRQQF